MTEREGLIADLRKTWEALPPPPRFDRIASRDLRPFDKFPRRPKTFDLAANRAIAFDGFPVVIDPDLEVGVIELRKGDEVVERLMLSELRA